jgi:hypothetical protein
LLLIVNTIKISGDFHAIVPGGNVKKMETFAVMQ